MRYGWGIILGLALGAGCDGQIGEGSGTAVAVFELQSDQLGALQLKECLAIKGENNCARYPNPDECKGMSITVGQDASVKADCLQKDGSRSEVAKGGLSIPFRCSPSGKPGQVRCLDIYRKLVLDTLNWQLPPELQNRQAEEQAGAGVETPAPSTPEPALCTGAYAAKTFATELNNLMSQWGLLRIYTPKVTGGNFLTDLVDAVGVCGYTSLENARLNGIPNPICRDAFGTKVCRCAYMANIATNETCKKMKAQCAGQKGGWEGALWLEAGNASLWLAFPSYKSTESGQNPGSGSGNSIGQAPDDTNPSSSVNPSGGAGIGQTPDNSGSGGSGTSPGTGTGSSPNDTNGSTNPGTNPGTSNPGGSNPGSSNPGGSTSSDNICTGSPLVLDLEDDGIETTSLEDGVRFDLLGTAPVRTAWLAQEDAFLAIDRNNNGRIDNGSELFGEASGLDKRPAANGFDALAAVDAKRHGGNDDGVVNAKDKLFGKLVLWTDRNHDGISQAGELKSLKKSRIRELTLKATYRVNSMDKNGNDQGLRGTFVRKDGSTGSMIDVYFNYTSETRQSLADRN